MRLTVRCWTGSAVPETRSFKFTEAGKFAAACPPFFGDIMSRTIVVGYGNIDRADDGVAYEVINALRRRLGQNPLIEGDTGLENLGASPDSIFLIQLMPEIMETLIDYDQIIFVDAHAGKDTHDLNCIPVKPEYVSSTFTHHMTPASLLAFMKVLYDREPPGHVVSIRGYNFDFQRMLSNSTRNLIPEAVEEILKLLKN